MTELESILNTECVGMSNEEALNFIKNKEVIVDGMATSGNVLSYIASINKLKEFRSISKNDSHPLQDVADASIVTLETREGFDFSSNTTILLMGSFVSAGVLSQEQADNIIALGKKIKKPYLSTNILDILKIKEPESVIPSTSNEVALIPNNENRYHDVVLTILGKVPASTAIKIEVRDNPNLPWIRVDGFNFISVEGTYTKRLHGEFIRSTTEIRCSCDLNLNMSITATVV